MLTHLKRQNQNHLLIKNKKIVYNKIRSLFLPRSDQAGWWQRTFSGRVPPMDAQVDSICIFIRIWIVIGLRTGSGMTTMVEGKEELTTVIIWSQIGLDILQITRGYGTIRTASFLSTTSVSVLFHPLQINWYKQYSNFNLVVSFQLIFLNYIKDIICSSTFATQALSRTDKTNWQNWQNLLKSLSLS